MLKQGSDFHFEISGNSTVLPFFSVSKVYFAALISVGELVKMYNSGNSSIDISPL